MKTQSKKTISAQAFQMSAGAFEFAAADATDKTRGPIKLTASSGAVFNHPWWGPLVFDFSGMTLAKPRVTLDYCHRQDEVVGYADKIDTSGGQLVVAGELVSARPDDRAAEILTKGPAGVPYEASVKFDPYNGLVIEEYQAGVPAQVNGRTELGPLTVIRKCLLRAVAVCPYGSDPYTQSEFSAGEGPAQVEVTIHQHEKECEMSKDTTAETPAKTNDQVRAELVAQTKDYSDRFGTELAAKWGPLGESKPLLECYAEFTSQLRAGHEAALAGRDTLHATAIAELQAKLTAAETNATELDTRLASLSLGETAPVSGGAGATSEKKNLTGMPAGAVAFSAEFKLPNSKTK